MDVLSAQRNILLGLGFLAQDLIGAGTLASGLACTATAPASMSVKIGAGRLYSLQNLDNTNYGSLALDTTHQVVKQGILLDAITLACPAPGTVGQSINYLIQATFSEVDGNLVILPYFNSANPQQTFAGPGNNATAQATVRQGTIVVSAKAGVAATTGTQTTPAPDTGYTGLYVVTVAQGATTIIAGNISLLGTAPFLTPGAGSGFFTLTGTGFTAGVTGTCYWRLDSGRVDLIVPSLAGTSNATTLTATGVPAALQPATGLPVQNCPIAIAKDNSAFVAGGYAAITAGSGTIQFGLLGSLPGWTNSGAKSVAGNISYRIS